MELWMQIVLGLFALAIIIFVGPHLKTAVQNSPKGSAQEWLGLLFPIGLVVLFVVVLIWLAQRA